MGCTPWGRWELDTSEHLHFHFSLLCTGEGNGNPLQCPWLENPRDRGAWWAAVYGVTQSRTRLKRLSSSSCCNSMGCSPPDSSVHGILQARILGWGAISFSRSSRPRNRTHDSCNVGRFFTTEPTGIPNVLWEHASAAAAKVLQSCLTLCDSIDGSPPGSPIPGILQAGTLEWVAISFFNA